MRVTVDDPGLCFCVHVRHLSSTGLSPLFAEDHMNFAISNQETFEHLLTLLRSSVLPRLGVLEQTI